MPNFHVGRNRKCGFLLYWLRVSWCIVLLKTQISLLIKQPMLANSPNREIIKVDPYEENARLPMRFEPTTVTITVQCSTTWAVDNVDQSSGVLPFDRRWRRQRRSRGSAGRSSSASPGQASSLGRTCGWGWNKIKLTSVNRRDSNSWRSHLLTRDSKNVSYQGFKNKLFF